MPNSRRKYDEEFKKRAVRLSYSSERSIKATAESLGINANMLHRWRNQYTPDGDKTKTAVQQDELNQLRCRIAEPPAIWKCRAVRKADQTTDMVLNKQFILVWGRGHLESL